MIGSVALWGSAVGLAVMGAKGLIGPDEIDWNDFAPEGEACGPVWLSGLKFDPPAGSGPLPRPPVAPLSGAWVAVIGWKDGEPRLGAVTDALPDIEGLAIPEFPPTPPFAAGRTAVEVHAGRKFAPVICGNCFPIAVPKDSGLKFDAPAGSGPLPRPPVAPLSGAWVAVIGWKDGEPRLGAVTDALPDIKGLAIPEFPPTPPFAAGRTAVEVHAGRKFAPVICGNCFPIAVPKDAAAAAVTTGAMGGNPSFGGGGRYSTGMLALEAIISCGSGGGRSL